jgi:hypothetical protein
MRPLIFIAAGLLILFWGWFPTKRDWVRDWAVPLLGLLGWLLLAVGAMVLGAKATAYLLFVSWPAVNDFVFQILCGLGGVGGLWIAVISTQFVENLARLSQGLPLEKIHWIKGGSVWRRHKS